MQTRLPCPRNGAAERPPASSVRVNWGVIFSFPRFGTEERVEGPGGDGPSPGRKPGVGSAPATCQLCGNRVLRLTPGAQAPGSAGATR